MAELNNYWRYYIGENSKEIYVIADVDTTAIGYLNLHTFVVKMAIDRFKGR